jgi:calcineurin-like phosphoesterase family protein
MNRTIVDNWNKTIRPEDVVYFLGDLVYGKSSRHPNYWLNKLNGNIEFIEGNHDKRVKRAMYPSAYNVVLKYGTWEFLLTHDPTIKPPEWDGWVIHGHKHNNDIENYPLINRKTKTINVAAEILDYKPMSFRELITKLNAS